jgi:hypothetical protein
LAAIAVPNFLEAQIRSKVSRARADMRTLATALESYIVDNNVYPNGNPNNNSARLLTDPQTDQFLVLERLSTPIAYLSSGLLIDPFSATRRSGVINSLTGASTPVQLPANELDQNRFFMYLATTTPGTGGVLALTNTPASRATRFWSVWSAGPTLIRPQVAGTGLLASNATIEANLAWIYDPTNGTVSRGGIFRTGGTGIFDPDPGANFFRATTLTNR